MAFAKKAIMDVLGIWLNTVVTVGWTVVKSDQNAEQFDKPYLDFRMGTITRVGDDYQGRPDNAGDNQITGNRDFILMIQATGDGAIAMLDDVRTSLNKFSVLETLRASGIAFVRDNPILNITAIEETKFFERGSLDILFRIASVVSDNVGKIERTLIDAEYYDEDGLVVADQIDININP